MIKKSISKVGDLKEEKCHSSNSQYFNHPTLNVDNQELLPESQRSNPDNFFKDIAMFVDLEDMEYCPVLLQLSQPAMIKNQNGNTYLLQVWDQEKNKIYEKSFKEPIKVWNICFKYFTYIVKEDEQEYLIIVNLKKQDKKKVKLINFQFFDKEEIKFVTYTNGYLYLAASNFFKILRINFNEEVEESTDASSLWQNSFATELKIHGLISNSDAKSSFNQLVVFETSDNQLEFNKFILKDRINFDYEWRQIQPVRPRMMPRLDKIKKVAHGVIKDVHVAIALRDENQCLLVPHGKYLSIYLITKKEWKQHILFKDDVLKSFRGKQGGQCLLLLNNGECYDINKISMDNDENEAVDNDSSILTIPGKIIRISEDVESLMALYMTVENNGNYELWVIFYGKKTRVLPEIKGCANLNACCLQYRDTTYVVIQNDHQYSLYKQEELRTFSLTLIRQYNNITEITGNLNNGTFYDLNDHLFLFDEVNMYVIKDKPYSIKVYPNVYCIGLQNFQNNYNYILCQEKNGNKNTGLRFFDMESVIKKEQLNNTLLKKIDIGTCGVFEWSGWLMRIVFIESLKNIIICPILHRNQHFFFDIASDSRLICKKIVKDKYLSLSKYGILQTHCIITAKQLSENTISYFEENKLAEMNRILLNNRDQCIFHQKSDEKIETQTFFQDWELQPSLKNQKTFGQQSIGKCSIHKFIVVEIKNEKEIQINSVFYFPMVDNSRDFRMHFNQKHDRMIVINNQKVCLYKSELVETPGSLDKVEPNMKKWVMIRQIDDYQIDFEDQQDTLTLITPDFTRYIINENRERQFKIKDALTDQVICMIPIHLMSYEIGEDANHVTNRFKFFDHDTFLITSKSGVEKKIKIDTVKNKLIEVEYNKRPLFNEVQKDDNGDFVVEWKISNYYYKRPQLTYNKSIRERLKRKYQEYKTEYFLNCQRDRVKFYEAMLNSDIHWPQQNEHSFTFIHWSLIDQIRKGELHVEELEDSVIEQMLYNILPGGNTALHILCNQPDELMKLVQRAHPTEDKILFHMPFLPNFEGLTPLHIMVMNKNFKTISFILKYLKNYEIDHHSRAIKDLYQNFILEDILEFHEYIDARFVKTEQLVNFNRGLLRQDTNGIIAKEIEFNEDQLRAEIMEPGVESRINCEFLDLGGIYHFKDSDFDSFFDALGTTDNIQIFGRRAIQTLIEFNYRKVREFVVRKLFIAFAIFHVTYLIFTFLIFERYQADQSKLNQVLFYIFSLILIFFSTYFLVFEAIQFKLEGFIYFTSFWNYVDLIPPFGIYALIIMIALVEEGISNITEQDIRIVFSIVTMFMWFKLLYFLRLFRNTSYLIRMIVEVVKDMRHFFLVILITIVAFGNAMLSLSLGNEIDEDGNSLRFTTGYVDSVIFAYRMVIGDFDTSEFGEVARPLVMIFFLLCTLFNMIVMLNLLIAIISETFNRVTANSELATYQEKAAIIGENNYLVPPREMKSYAPKNKILLTIKDLERVIDQRKDPIIARVDVLEEVLGAKISQFIELDTLTKVQDSIKDLHQKNETNSEKILEVRRILKTMTKKKETKMTMIYNKPLEKYMVYEIAEEQQDSTFQWRCKAKHFTKCPKIDSTHLTDLNEVLYHCEECQSFNFCDICYSRFRRIHKHELKSMTYEQLKAKSPDQYQEGWRCAGSKFKECVSKEKFPRKDLDEIFYADKEAEFYVCLECTDNYQIKE